VSRLTHRTAPGCTYFVTTKSWEGRAIFQVPATAEILVQCILGYRDKGAYCLHEFVVMPNHLHVIITPGHGTTLEKAIQLIKGGSSYEIHRLREHKMEIWQRGFHEATVRDERDYVARRHYVRMNPVVEKLVERPGDWAYSSANSKFALDGMPDRLKSVIPI
jgi:putative transposase